MRIGTKQANIMVETKHENSVKVSTGIQATQELTNNSTNTEKTEQDETESLPKLQLSSNRSKQYSERNKLRQISPPHESAKFTNPDLDSSGTLPDSIESRVQALKQANQYLRMEVENACKMINSSVLNRNTMEDEFLSMPKVKYSNLIQFDIGDHKHKVEFLNEPDHYIKYADESLIEQESKTIWLEQAESVRCEFKMVDHMQFYKPFDLMCNPLSFFNPIS
ncbi:unnamed protein product [Schistosoma turkestanicum]|nr:unnamed protein product [Schistosoma turkestanicum]